MKAIILLALSIIILSQSYGLAYSALPTEGTECELQQRECVNVTTDSTSYETGEVINISGAILDYNESDPFKNFDVTLRVIDPKNNIINISQIELDGGGYYSTSVVAQGPLWKFGWCCT